MYILYIFLVTQRNCAVILYNLASSNDNCALMLEAGALMHVVHLTQAPLSATKMKCAAILSRLSLHAKHYDQFSKHDVLRVLLELCNVDNIMTQRRLVIAISNLSQVNHFVTFLAYLPYFVLYCICTTFRPCLLLFPLHILSLMHTPVSSNLILIVVPDLIGKLLLLSHPLISVAT